jgi:hypothetical protein
MLFFMVTFSTLEMKEKGDNFPVTPKVNFNIKEDEVCSLRDIITHIL